MKKETIQSVAIGSIAVLGTMGVIALPAELPGPSSVEQAYASTGKWSPEYAPVRTEHDSLRQTGFLVGIATGLAVAGAAGVVGAIRYKRKNNESSADDENEISNELTEENESIGKEEKGK